ncbi:hypothetical protein CtesDRAFT_PD1231 [Comamonas testosteroni KF-1]|uniref:Uncharacterized protein n=1 Tax=Comamonas testosteroni (strain DSM 14576 / KF-1) TaxID=399795 RepID=B7X0D5_COMTK|nr:hypothetical protein CtesDRAFT_PD1231 [Comamonas testosteroni KF-1]
MFQVTSKTQAPPMAPRFTTLVTAGTLAIAACAEAAQKSKPTTTNLLTTQAQIDDLFILIPL